MAEIYPRKALEDISITCLNVDRIKTPGTSARPYVDGDCKYFYNPSLQAYGCVLNKDGKTCAL